MMRVAESFVEGEKKIGIDAHLANPQDETTWIWDADINVSHTHLPDAVRRKGKKPTVWVSHGTPEHVFQSSVEQAVGYGHADGWMLAQNWLRTADAIVTFWPRHQWIWQSLCDKGRKVNLVPLGVDKDFWKPLDSIGKFAGEPSVLTAENAHYIKWPLDLFLFWPLMREELMGATLHALYLPNDQHRWFFPLINRNGCSYASYVSGGAMSHSSLRNAMVSTDYYCGLVRYGDFNRISLEANACGAKTISYRGNPYSDFWITEGDQREMAKEMLAILKKEIEPREKQVVPNIEDMAKVMKEEVYDKL